ncbi:MAG: hypothetical protein GX627_01225 [Parcubacteria group bacterium]|jgi:hypothetical protein|nr:hypothetical protein [Parcubacteria group bacterium]
MLKFYKIIITSLLVVCVTFSPKFAQRVYAQYVDIVQDVKELYLDPLAWITAKMILEKFTASAVSWINSGFDGSPAFVTNPGSFFTTAADAAIGEFIFSNDELNFLCTPDLSVKLKIALARAADRERNYYQCTLTDVVDNVEDFMNDFNRGGWDAFLEMTQNQSNTPLGLYIRAENKMMQRAEARVNERLKDLDWGGGMMSFKSCSASTAKFCEEACADAGDNKKNCINSCKDKPKEELCNLAGGTLSTKTPGSVIGAQLERALGSAGATLEIADEVSEIVGALTVQLTSKVFSSGGLLSASSKKDGYSLVDRLAENSERAVSDVYGEYSQGNVVPETPTIPKTIKIKDDKIIIDNNPIGRLESVNYQTFEGWACDADDYEKALTIRFYNGELNNGGILIGSTIANLTGGPNVSTNCGGYSAHKFSFATPYYFQNTSSYNIYAYAVNLGSEDYIKLEGSPKILSGGSGSTTDPVVNPVTNPTIDPISDLVFGDRDCLMTDPTAINAMAQPFINSLPPNMDALEREILIRNYLSTLDCPPEGIH